MSSKEMPHASDGLQVEMPTDGRIRTLIVGTDDWAIEQAADQLEGAGYGVLRCHEPGAPAFPCNALIAGGTCPLDVGFHAVVDVRARALSAPAPGEFGVVCALRQGVPLVVAGVASSYGPFQALASTMVETGRDVVEACREVIGQATDDAAPLTDAIGRR